MGRALLSLLALAAATPCLAAAPAPAGLDVAFSNTIVSTYPDGRQGHLWLNKDGTYRYQGRSKKPSDGKWTVKGSQVCLKQQHPVAILFTYCTPVPSGGIGTSWNAKAVTGEKIKVTVVAGR